MISISPTQNVGSEKPRIEPAIMLFAANESGFKPAQSPSGRPITMAITIAVSASSTVAGMRCNISCTAGTLEANDLPRSPEKAALTKLQYCTHTGLSRPSAAVTRAISA